MDGKDTQRVRITDTSSVVIRGDVSITSPLLRKLADCSIPVSFQSYGGWWSATLTPPGGHNVLGRMAQHRIVNAPDQALDISKRIVAQKILNTRVLLRRNGQASTDTLTRMKSQADQAGIAADYQTLLGHEGEAARLYFQNFPTMIRNQEMAARFQANGRSRRPPTDPVNAALSLAYANLTRVCTEALARVGLDPTVGILHRPRAGKPALALDLMEEFRAVIGDSAVVRAFNTGAVGADDFIIRPGGVTFTKTGRRTFIRLLERRWKEEVTHPLFNRPMDYLRVVEVQARMLSKAFLREAPYQPIRIR
jgi:CRISPR-associated endonuclease Cas1